MSCSLAPAELVELGIDHALAEDICRGLRELPADLPAPEQWRWVSTSVLSPAVPFAVHRRVLAAIYAAWDASLGPPPAWLPDPRQVSSSNIGRLMAEQSLDSFAALHRWSVTERESFWAAMVRNLGIRFERPPDAVVSYQDGPETPSWLPGATLNIAASCFQASPDAVAVVYQKPGGPIRQCTYGELDALSNRVANSLCARGFAAGDSIAVDMPMTLASVAIYLGIVKMGGVVVSITDSFSAAEIATRLRLAGAAGIVTQDVITASKGEPLYAKIVAAGGPRAIVLPAAGLDCELGIDLRSGDVSWQAFLVDDADFAPVPRRPADHSNVLFSSGTTADPKVIPWTHTTPIRSAADGYLHHDIRPRDVVAWPTSLGWMMGPWLVYATLINRATIALFGAAPIGRPFGEFVRDAGVTVLGLVPSMVKSWRRTRCMEGIDWSRIKLFSSTGECSNTEDYLYLMMLAGYKPVIEYCGGTEIGGGYITGTVVQPASPGTFSTPALGMDVVILGDDGRRAKKGELFLVPPSIGLSNELLNQDHHAIYYEDVPRGPDGQMLRRHGDQMEDLGGGYFRSHGRADDTMNLKGIKVSSAEVERVLNRVPGVHETAAVAISPVDGGPSQLVVYAVELHGHAVEPSRLRVAMQSAMRDHYGTVFKIADVQMIDALPRTASNKVMRRSLRDAYARRAGESNG